MSSKTPIFDWLPAGRENAVSLGLIMRHFGLSNREARRLIEAERLRGAAILSSVEGSGGYFRPATASEAQRFAASQRSRAYQILKSVQTAENAALLLKKEKEERQNINS